MKFKTSLLLLSVLCITANNLTAQAIRNSVSLSGEMKNVMWKGQLFGTINIDTIKNKKNLYGLGPLEYLSGEILILNGTSYIATVINDSAMKVSVTNNIKAPFFGYANIEKWEERIFPESISTIQHLENYIDSTTKLSTRPFLFKLTGTVDSAKIHVVNLPKGLQVNSPTVAHIGQVNYTIKDEQIEIIGFFSNEHKSIFTHHDTFLHMHLITKNKQKMGHLDNVYFKKGTMKFFIPFE